MKRGAFLGHECRQRKYQEDGEKLRCRRKERTDGTKS